MSMLISLRIASKASHTVVSADGFWDSEWIWMGTRGFGGQLWLHGCAEAILMDLRGLLDSIKNIFRMQAVVCAFWFGLQQLLDYFFTWEELGPKSLISGDVLHFVHVF